MDSGCFAGHPIALLQSKQPLPICYTTCFLFQAKLCGLQAWGDFPDSGGAGGRGLGGGGRRLRLGNQDNLEAHKPAVSHASHLNNFLAVVVQSGREWGYGELGCSGRGGGSVQDRPSRLPPHHHQGELLLRGLVRAVPGLGRSRAGGQPGPQLGHPQQALELPGRLVVRTVNVNQSYCLQALLYI